MMLTAVCAVLAILFTPTFAKSYEKFYVYWDSENGIQISTEKLPNVVYCCDGYFKENFNDDGWNKLYLHTYNVCTNREQAFAAGLAEAWVAFDDIYNHWYNTMNGMCENRTKLCQKIDLFYEQLEGLTVGYNFYQKNPERKLTFNDLLWLNIQGDIEELLDALNSDEEEYESFLVRGAKLPGSKSCSALVKLLPDSYDLYTSHDTWSSFQSMYKVMKNFQFEYNIIPTDNTTIPAASISFSSYPGVIQSGDDFYVTSTGLTVMETTIGNNNRSLWSYVNAEGQVLEQIRALVATRLSTGGKQWSSIFSQYNSGTYNNQWMIVDYKLFKAGTPQKELKKDLLWVLEQLPGHIKAADKTDVLREQSYWPSYNIPYFPEIFNLSDNQKLVEKYGDWFTYDKSPRALIFKRDHVKVNDSSSMVALMRYNDYKHDPLSKCNCTPPYSGENAIAARNDVNPANGTYPFAALGHRSHSATDMKLTTSVLAPTLQFIAWSGPPYSDDLPPFQWSTSDYNHLAHLGQPDIWKFKPILFDWKKMQTKIHLKDF
ncbi:putative phospholipase B-like 2 [Blattella germanica]|nr:putative phospholipase B-like 2 [Blattella germanica]